MTDRMTDRMTTKVLSSHPRIKCGETNKITLKIVYGTRTCTIENQTEADVIPTRTPYTVCEIV